MNDWKELKKDNLPPDILTGDYEFQYFSIDVWLDENGSYLDLVSDLINGAKFRYRKKQKPAPTHEQIMTKWFRSSDRNIWVRVIFYSPNKVHPYCIYYDDFVIETVSRDWFTDKESADIPPE